MRFINENASVNSVDLCIDTHVTCSLFHLNISQGYYIHKLSIPVLRYTVLIALAITYIILHLSLLNK